MRTIRPTRNLGDPRSNDVQTIIAERPVTCVVVRPNQSRRNDSLSETTVATFQGRIDPWRQSYGDARTSAAGHEVDLTFLLTTLYSTDVDGNTIDYMQGDEITAGGQVYIVTHCIPYPSFKKEGVLRLRQ
jgi:hypothetical protein